MFVYYVKIKLDIEQCISGQNEKSEEGKLTDNTLSNTNPAGTAKTALGTGSGSSVTVPTEKIKDNIKEEPAALKD